MTLGQFEIHRRIDELISGDPSHQDAHTVSEVLALNFDARNYFFATVDERWIDWLWNNGFLAALTDGSEAGPELGYLTRMAKVTAPKVAEIIAALSFSENAPNLATLDQCLWIIPTLPTEQISQLIPKIHRENWVQLLGERNRYGVEYGMMMRRLAEAKDFDNLLLLADVILTVRKGGSQTSESPFYLTSLSEVEVFRYLTQLDDTHTEKALELIAKVLREILSLEAEPNRFKVEFALRHLNLFTVDSPGDPHGSLSELEGIGSTYAILLRSIIERKGDDPAEVKEIYDQYVAILPEGDIAWHASLMTWALSPKVFPTELKDALFKIFAEKKPWELMGGAEYEEAFRRGFAHWLVEDRDAFISSFIEHFGKQEVKEWEYYHSKGLRLFSLVRENLSEKQRTVVEKTFGPLSLDYQPKPSIQFSGVRSISSKAPPSASERIATMKMEELATALQQEWTPKKIHEDDIEDDFHNPTNAEGLFAAIQFDMEKRLQEYVDGAPLFFQRNKLDEHYTYAFLRAIHGLVQKNPDLLKTLKWSGVVDMMLQIAISGTEEAFVDRERAERREYGTWLTSWTAVHDAMADMVQEMIKASGEGLSIDFTKDRDNFQLIISYLLRYPDPTPEQEKNRDSEPFMAAINSVRGRAFEAFAQFIYKDDKQIPKGETHRIREDSKRIFEGVLDMEDTQAISFLFGYYLASFYYRDKEWIRGLLPRIFSDDLSKKDLRLASWEGYLSNNLYPELFDELGEYYRQAIAMDPAQYPERKYFKKPDEGLGTHIALAYSHFQKFDHEHPLFKAFWETEKSHSEYQQRFLSFIGRAYISGDQIAENGLMLKERLEWLWDFVLDNDFSIGVLMEFGYWIPQRPKVFDIPWLAERVKRTLEKTEGNLDWDYGLREILREMAEVSPRQTLDILRLYLSFKAGADNFQGGWLGVDERMIGAFRIIYNNLDPNMKDEVRGLVNKLLPQKSGMFWKLKEAIE